MRPHPSSEREKTHLSCGADRFCGGNPAVSMIEDQQMCWIHFISHETFAGPIIGRTRNLHCLDPRSVASRLLPSVYERTATFLSIFHRQSAESTGTSLLIVYVNFRYIFSYYKLCLKFIKPFLQCLILMTECREMMCISMTLCTLCRGLSRSVVLSSLQPSRAFRDIVQILDSHFTAICRTSRSVSKSKSVSTVFFLSLTFALQRDKQVLQKVWQIVVSFNCE